MYPQDDQLPIFNNVLHSSRVTAAWPPSKGFNVAKLLVGVSVVTSVAARLTGAKWLPLPDVSAPIPLAFVPVPVCLNSIKKP